MAEGDGQPQTRAPEVPDCHRIGGHPPGAWDHPRVPLQRASSTDCPSAVAFVRLNPGAYLVDKSLTRTTKGMITNFGDHALDVQLCVVAGAGFEPATSGL